MILSLASIITAYLHRLCTTGQPRVGGFDDGVAELGGVEVGGDEGGGRYTGPFTLATWTAGSCNAARTWWVGVRPHRREGIAVGRPPPELAAFCRREHPRLVGALSLYCGDAALAEELAQEALTRVCQRWEHVSSRYAPGAWTHRVALNLAHSWYRRRAAERRALARHGADPPVDPASADQLAVRAAVARLPHAERRVVVLRYYLGYSVQDVAELGGQTPEAVRVLTHRAVNRLRGHLGTPHTEAPHVTA